RVDRPMHAAGVVPLLPVADDVLISGSVHAAAERTASRRQRVVDAVRDRRHRLEKRKDRAEVLVCLLARLRRLSFLMERPVTLDAPVAPRSATEMERNKKIARDRRT